MTLQSSPSTTLYTLGKGIVSIGEWVLAGTTGPSGYTDIGNCPKFDVNVTETTLDHFSSRSGMKTKDKVVTLEIGYDLTFDLEEMSINNLKMFLKGEISGAGGNVILGATQAGKEFAVKFVADNPAGPNETWEFWRCNMAAGGALSLIGDTWVKMSLKATGLADTVNHSTSPYFTVTFATTTSTTTTTTTTA